MFNIQEENWDLNDINGFIQKVAKKDRIHDIIRCKCLDLFQILQNPETRGIGPSKLALTGP